MTEVCLDVWLRFSMIIARIMIDFVIIVTKNMDGYMNSKIVKNGA